MLRKLIVTFTAITVMAVLVCSTASFKVRSLASAELWSTNGGASVAERCCQVLPICADAAEHCDDWGHGRCEDEGREVLTFTGNKKGCVKPDDTVPTCTYDSTNEHTCQTVYPECVWDDESHKCVIDSAFRHSDKKAPDSCSPNCI